MRSREVEKAGVSRAGRISDKRIGRNRQTPGGRPILLALAAGTLVLAGCHKKEAAAAGRPTPSGLPVPRYVSLRFATVNARGGPGDDYKLVWVYRTKGLPLQVIAETPDWRKVCDPEGGVAWVHKRTLDSRRNVIRWQGGDLPLRKRPEETAGTGATLRGKTLAELDKCAEGWCRVSSGGGKGWVRAADIWGAEEAPQCGATPPTAATPPKG